MKKNKEISVVFVCMGNICRSPTAEGVFRHLVEERNMSDVIHIDSAGTHAYHVGEPPDSRSQATALSRGVVNLGSQRARKIKWEDFDSFDYVIAMDCSNLEYLKNIKDKSQPAKLHLFMDFANGLDNKEVPDPYYGGENGFEQVFDMVQSASEGLLQHIIDKDLKN